MRWKKSDFAYLPEDCGYEVEKYRKPPLTARNFPPLDHVCISRRNHQLRSGKSDSKRAIAKIARLFQQTKKKRKKKNRKFLSGKTLFPATRRVGCYS